MEYAKEIIGDYQCGFRRNHSIIDQIFSLHQILEKKLEYNGVVDQCYIDFKKGYDSIDRQIMYNVFIEQGIPKKLVNMVRMGMSETFDKVRIGNNCKEKFEVRSGLKQGDSLPHVLLFYLTLEYVINEVIHNARGLNFNTDSKISVLRFADDLALLGEDTETIKLNTQTLINAAKEIRLEINSDKTEYKVNRRKGRNFCDIVVGENMFEHVENFKYLASMVTRRKEIQKEMKARLKAGNACYYSVSKLLSSRLLSRNLKSEFIKQSSFHLFCA